MDLLPVLFGTAGFNTSDIDRIARSFKPKDYDRDDHVVEAGQVNMHLGFIEQGMFQYHFPANGGERTACVTAENTFLPSVAGFLNGKITVDRDMVIGSSTRPCPRREVPHRTRWQRVAESRVG